MGAASERERLSRVMIVEDDPAQLITLTDILQEEGFEVVGCATAAEALRHVTSDKIGVAILDQRLPDQDGLKLLEQFHALNGHVRVIIHTAYGSFGSAKEAVNNGAFAYVEKLADPGELVRQVHRAVQEHVQRYAAELETAVTERTLALRESESRLRAIVAAAVDAIIVIDEQGTVDTFNPAAEQTFGYPASEVIGRNVSLLMPSPDSERHDSYITNYLRTGKRKVIGIRREVMARRKDGTTFPADLGISEMHADEHRWFVGIIRDNSEQRRLEDELRQSQKLEAIGRLAGGVAHDFNNLLTIITGYCGLLLAGNRPDQFWRQSVEEIEKAGNRAASLVRQLLAFSRKQILQTKVIDLNQVVTSTNSMLRRLIGEDVELITLLDNALWPIKADPGQIEQVLMNLVVNARDAMPQGGRLTLATANVILQKSQLRTKPDIQPGPYAMLTVTDTGHGMDQLTVVRAFEPFFTTKDVGIGTGLGLSTVYGIIKQSGGAIYVTSEVGQGTTFTIYFPPAGEPIQVPEARQEISDLPSGTETILVIEDEEGVRTLASQILQKSGYTVLQAGNGTEALTLSAKHSGPIQMLVTDVVMPGMSGPELARQLRLARPETKILYISGYLDGTRFQHQALTPDAPLLPKPFTPAVLVRKVREILDNKG